MRISEVTSAVVTFEHAGPELMAVASQLTRCSRRQCAVVVAEPAKQPEGLALDCSSWPCESDDDAWSALPSHGLLPASTIQKECAVTMHGDIQHMRPPDDAPIRSALSSSRSGPDSSQVRRQRLMTGYAVTCILPDQRCSPQTPNTNGRCFMAAVKHLRASVRRLLSPSNRYGTVAPSDRTVSYVGRLPSA